MGTLDPAQKAAAMGNAAAQLVLAGPGSGKTTTLTGRFVHLVRQGIDPARILALTFTKKAADEMKARIVRALALSSDAGLTVATFHGYSFRHLRRNPQLAGLADHFQLWDAPQQRHVFSSRKMWWNEETDILDIIGGAKERLIDAKTFAARVKADDEVESEAVRFFQVYEQALRAAGAIDFADMVPRLVAAMDRNPAYAAAVTGAFEHLLVDEFQDVNPGQVELIDRFARAGVKLWAVGDDDQTLYAFRAADVRFILDFPRKYRGAQVHVLDRNYRSSSEVVAAAKRLIANNRARRDKNYQSTAAEPGEIVIRGYRNAEIEARQVAKAVATLLARGLAPRQIAVLYRMGTIGLTQQLAFQAQRIPHEVRGSGDIWQSVAARLVVGSLHYLRDGTSDEAMIRMGSSRRAHIVRERLDQAKSEIKSGMKSGTTGGPKLDFPAACMFVRDTVAKAVPRQASDRDRAEWNSVVEIVTALASSCPSLDELETRIAAQSAMLRKPPENAVVLSTIHSAKGLEWDAVFLAGIEDGVIPHANNADREEERRVAYVGITRAKRLLGLSYAIERFGQPSRPSPFLRELNGGDRSFYVWTSPQTTQSDERMPLLSGRERERLVGGCLPPARAPTLPSPASGGGLGRGRKQSTPGKTTTKANKQSKVQAPRHGRAWSADEDRQLMAMFRSGSSVKAMAKALERGNGAIRSRLVKLGLMQES